MKFIVKTKPNHVHDVILANNSGKYLFLLDLGFHGNIAGKYELHSNGACAEWLVVSILLGRWRRQHGVTEAGTLTLIGLLENHPPDEVSDLLRLIQ